MTGFKKVLDLFSWFLPKCYASKSPVELFEGGWGEPPTFPSPHKTYSEFKSRNEVPVIFSLTDGLENSLMLFFLRWLCFK